MQGRILTRFGRIALLILGTAFLAFGTAAFLLPFSLVTGGISGLALVLERALSSPFWTAERFIACLTWGSFLLGLLILGWRFTARTLVSVLLYPPLVRIFAGIAPMFAGGISVIPAALLGGGLVGAGCALSFLGGGSTGGTDVLALSISFAFGGRVSRPLAVFLIDSAIILGGLFVLRDIRGTLIGIASALSGALVMHPILRE